MPNGTYGVVRGVGVNLSSYSIKIQCHLWKQIELVIHSQEHHNQINDQLILKELLIFCSIFIKIGFIVFLIFQTQIKKPDTMYLGLKNCCVQKMPLKEGQHDIRTRLTVNYLTRSLALFQRASNFSRALLKSSAVITSWM